MYGMRHAKNVDTIPRNVQSLNLETKGAGGVAVASQEIIVIERLKQTGTNRGKVMDAANVEFVKLLNQMTREQKDMCVLSHSFNAAWFTQSELNRGENVSKQDAKVLRDVKSILGEYGFNISGLTEEIL